MRSLVYSVAVAFALASVVPIASAKENPPVKGAYDLVVIDKASVPSNYKDIARAVEHHCRKHHKCHKPCIKGDKRKRCQPCKPGDKRKHCRKEERRHASAKKSA